MSLSYAPTDWEELYPLDWALAPLLKPKGPIRPPRSLAPRQDAASPFQNLDSSLDWTVKTHIVPAAWPRTRQRSAQNRTLPFPLSIHTLGRSGRGSTREEARWLEQHNRPPLVDLSSPYAYEDQEQLWIAVNRYAPKQARTGGYTLVLAHGALPLSLQRISRC